MGTDLDGYMEVNIGGTWYCVTKPRLTLINSNEVAYLPSCSSVMIRDYLLFSVLSNHGLGGFERHKRISEYARGLPLDASELVKNDFLYNGKYHYSPSWVLMSELKDWLIQHGENILVFKRDASIIIGTHRIKEFYKQCLSVVKIDNICDELKPSDANSFSLDKMRLVFYYDQ